MAGELTLKWISVILESRLIGVEAVVELSHLLQLSFAIVSSFQRLKVYTF